MSPPPRLDAAKAWYRRLVPPAVRQPISRVRTAPGVAVLHSSTLARTKQGRRMQDALHRRSQERRQAATDAGSPLASLVQEDVVHVERRAARQRTTSSRFSFLAAHLELRHDEPLNRCSPAHLRSMHERFAGEAIEGRTVLEVGAGTQNPFGLLLLLVLLGADEAIGIEPEEVEDEQAAARTAALTVSWLLTAPRMVLGKGQVPTQTIAERAAELDCERLWRGDLGALDDSRVTLLRHPAGATGLADDSVELVISNSVLEHLERPADDIAEMARVTRPGGRACHAIDASDHHRYAVDGLNQLAFLEIDSADALVHGSNRLRPHQLAELFEQTGFVVDEVRPTFTIDVRDKERRGFIDPFRSMPLEQLAVTHALLRAHLPVEGAAD
jgi:SAM-dependent methyltransferase